MRSFLKKKSKAELPGVSTWHPDFRNHEQLPDIKVIRTAFFINGAAISVSLVLFAYFGTREWQVFGVNRQIDDWQQQIDRDKRGSDLAVTLYKRFQAEESRILEVDTFTKSKSRMSELLLHLGMTLPKNVALDVFEVKSTGLVLRGTISGASNQAAGYASAYIEQLKSDSFMATRFDDIALNGLTRNSGNNRVVIDLFLKFKAGKEAKKP